VDKLEFPLELAQALPIPGLFIAQKLQFRSRLLELGLHLGVASAFPFEVGLELTLTLVTLAAPQPAVYWTAIVAAELCLFASTGPINSVIVNVVAPHMRATAVALSIFTIHLLGDVPSPSLVGVVSDARSLGEAVLIIPFAVLVGGVVWTYAAWRGGRAGGEPSP